MPQDDCRSPWPGTGRSRSGYSVNGARPKNSPDSDYTKYLHLEMGQRDPYELWVATTWRCLYDHSKLVPACTRANSAVMVARKQAPGACSIPDRLDPAQAHDSTERSAHRDGRRTRAEKPYQHCIGQRRNPARPSVLHAVTRATCPITSRLAFEWSLLLVSHSVSLTARPAARAVWRSANSQNAARAAGASAASADLWNSSASSSNLADVSGGLMIGLDISRVGKGRDSLMQAPDISRVHWSSRAAYRSRGHQHSAPAAPR